MKKINLKNLQNIRKNKGYTIKYMAEKLNICVAYYCQIEKGNRNLSYKKAIEIADVFNLTPDELFLKEE